VEGRRRFRGTLVSFVEGLLILEVDGREQRIPIDEVKKANTVYQFKREDFASQRKSGRKAADEDPGSQPR